MNPPYVSFEVTSARAEPYAVQPTIVFRLRMTTSSPLPVHSALLRCQVRIEPQVRGYVAAEVDGLRAIFGERSQWSDTLRPFLWTHVTAVVPPFEGSTDIDVPVVSSYDLEVAGGKYFQSLTQGEVGVLLLFSGTIFHATETGFSVQQVPWECEATYRLPLQTWRDAVDACFPGQGWLKLSRETLSMLQSYQARRALPGFDAAVRELLAVAQSEATA